MNSKTRCVYCCNWCSKRTVGYQQLVTLHNAKGFEHRALILCAKCAWEFHKSIVRDFQKNQFGESEVAK